MAGHPDVAEISDLAEGLLPPARTTDVRRHLETCEPCADVYASLEEIQGLLGTLPGPQRMPDDVAERIDAALAAEALLNAAAPAAPDASAEDEGHDGTHVSRETCATDRPSGRARTSTTGPGRKDRRRTGRRRIAALGAVAAAAALGIGSVIVASVTGGSPADDTAAHKQQTAPVDTFSEAKLQQQVTELVGGDGQDTRSGPRTPHSFGTQSETENHVLTQPTIVPECVQKAIGRDDAALATEEGVYKGREALLVVLPDTLNGSRVTAYIVDSACVDQPAVGKATVLLQHTYTQP
ncbi:zf-HC2 domain-containing protein [Streptomyces sp. NPDC032940]|uniref:anti-sigma factor family protein n=1 Tax=Streptomyces sp. NPDC032940 TaxID=3155366 RepID=UPI00340FF5AD